MKKRLLFALIVGVGVLAVPAAQAGTTTDSISIHFGADEPTQVAGSMLAPTDVAGAIPSANWNNVTTNTGLQTNLIEDVNGAATASGAQVFWFASNTWSSTGKGEENNNFTGADQTLMSGYLDMQVQTPAVTFIQVTNLPASFSGTYDVYVYALAGVPGRGGVYSVNADGSNSSVPKAYQYYVNSGITDSTKTGNQGLYSGPAYFQATGDDNTFGADGVNTNDFGNYMLFFQESGPTVTITAISQPMPSLTGYSGTVRAPLNGIQIVVD